MFEFLRISRHHLHEKEYREILETDLPRLQVWLIPFLKNVYYYEYLRKVMQIHRGVGVVSQVCGSYKSG